jgi:hypothetical protein
MLTALLFSGCSTIGFIFSGIYRLDIPTNLDALVKEDSVILSWTEAENAHGYEIRLSYWHTHTILKSAATQIDISEHITGTGLHRITIRAMGGETRGRTYIDSDWLNPTVRFTIVVVPNSNTGGAE